MAFTLKNTIIESLAKAILERKIKFMDIRDKLPTMLRGELLELLITKSKKYFNTKIHDNLRTELMVKTCLDIEIHEDMVMVGQGNEIDRELIRDIVIKFDSPRIIYTIVSDIDMINSGEVALDELEEEDIIMASDNYKEVKQKAEELNLTDHIIELDATEYTIKEFQHPNWPRTMEFIRKHADVITEYEDNDSATDYMVDGYILGI